VTSRVQDKAEAQLRDGSLMPAGANTQAAQQTGRKHGGGSRGAGGGVGEWVQVGTGAEAEATGDESAMPAGTGT
jgi:hypothetical protein